MTPFNKPSKFPKDQIRRASLWATASSIGLSLVFAILLGAAGGYFLDRYLGTQPWFFIGGLIVGVVAGYRNVFILASRLERAEALAKKANLSKNVSNPASEAKNASNPAFEAKNASNPEFQDKNDPKPDPKDKKDPS
ncbi:MAG: AtpZ/AtpI family protein [Deltaproteobacteria bacterium]|jgi:ATP synthase protein I|nr:AtpZ/AtpI family protein [Deltaproteobacteria bacterium]